MGGDAALKLIEAIEGLRFIALAGPRDMEIEGISYDSREVKEGDLFVCIKGQKYDGHNFAHEAIKRGARAILASRELDLPEDIALIKVEDPRRAMAQVAKRFFGDPSSALLLVGVTGTNGKTTTTYLVKSIFEAWGRPTGLIGTIQYMIADSVYPASRTTPESRDLQEFMARMVKAGARCAVMEVSSHAIDQGRIDGLDFDVGIFTNITQDHLDYHKSFEEYLRVKASFFEMLGREGKISIINVDDPNSGAILEYIPSGAVTYGLGEGARYRAYDVDLAPEGAAFKVAAPFGEIGLRLRLPGMFNVYNALGAFACGAESGVEPEAIKKGLEAVSGVPGRLERVDRGQDFSVIVDYAHTPDGLENVLKAISGFARGRKIVVFGCGGDRDRGKRPKMGAIAARLADYVIITSDNPRSEEPEAICREVEAGVLEVRSRGQDYHITVDRRQAICEAINLARPGDVVLIAGKGHETYQIFKDRTIDFDDRAVAGELLEERLEGDGVFA